MTEAWLEAIAPELEARVHSVVVAHRLPGASVGVVRPGGLAFRTHAGLADPASRRPADDATVYRVASLTKTLTAVALVVLRDRGRLRLDDPILRHLPEFGRVRALRGRCEDVTLAQLLAHRAGLESEGPFDHWDAMAFPTRDALLERLSHTTLVLDPGRAVKYSNLAYALLGEVIARVAGEPYERFVTNALLAPLGMTSSGFALDAALRARLATGHRPQQAGGPGEEAGYTETDAFAAACGLATTLPDLARWIALQLEAGPPVHGAESRPLAKDTSTTVPGLSRRSLDEMHQPLVLDPDWRDGRCLGWQAMRQAERVFIGHGGSIHGFMAWAIFHRATRCGVIVLTNQGRHDHAMSLVFELAERVVAAAIAARLDPVMPSTIPSSTDAVCADVRDLCGLYRMRFGGLVRMTWRGGEFSIETEPGEPLAVHAGPLAGTDTPRVLRAEGGRAAGELVRFEPATGPVQRFVVSGFAYDRVAD
jgi:CubicO group peptidase (beta-lactamase class C family)